MTARPVVAVAVHDGYYGCGTGAGYANFGFLDALTTLLPAQAKLVLLPVWLDSPGWERHPRWHAQARRLLDRVDAEVLPVANGTGGRDRWGGLAHFRQLAQDTARRIREEVAPAAGELLIIGFDVPFLGLAGALPAELRSRTVLIPRSSALNHTPDDADRIDWERATLHAGLAEGTRIGVISEYMGEHLRTGYGVPARAQVSLRDGLSHLEWARYHHTEPAAPEVPLPPSFLFAMGRAQPYKGFDDLLDALALLRQAGVELPPLVLAASDEAPQPTEYQEKLWSRGDELGLSVTVLSRFTPQVADLLGHPGLRAVIVPSRVEPFGRIPLEAFAAGGAPVVATTAGGLAEQVLDGRTGFSCPPADPPRLAEAIRRALALGARERASMRRTAFAHAVRRHDHVDAVRRFLAEVAPWLGPPGSDDRLRLLSTAVPPVLAGSPVSTVPPVKVPIGLQSRHWNTVAPERVVLVVAHHVTSLLRLLDVVTVFDSDPRVQVVFSWNGSDPFRHGLHQFLDQLGVVTIPWHQAIGTEFDLAIAANFGGLTELNAPIVILPHGAGYAKYSPGARSPEPGARSPEPGARSPEPGARSPEPGARVPFGFGPEWLLYDGRPIAEALVLSHQDELHLLRAATPAAAHTAVIAGDPCFDRMLRSLRLRARYRAALGVEPGQKLITITSTWSERSLMGAWPSLFRETLAGLDAESYRVCALLHPNIWHGHGPWQVNTWLADCVRAGLLLIPPTEGWQTGLVAADLVLGDHGATSCYAAALGAKVLLASFPDLDVVPGSAADLLGRSAPRLHRHTPLRAQIEQALSTSSPEHAQPIRDALTSCPGESAGRLRELFYRHLRLPEPATAVPVPTIPPQSPTVPPRQTETADHILCTATETAPVLTRYPAETTGADQDHLDAACLVVHEDHAQQTLVHKASVVLVTDLADARQRHPAATVLATAAPGDCVLRIRDSWEIRLHTPAPDLAAAFLYHWLANRGDPARLPGELTLRTGSRTVALSSIVVSRISPGAAGARR